MKFRLIAASAALLASGALQAQSGVALYGVADVGIEFLNRASKGHAPGADGRTVRMSSGNLSGSRWGLRGAEDLGQGLKAVFTLESGFHLDTGSTGGGSRLFDRQALVGLQGGFGSLTLGRQQTPVFDFALAYDPMSLSPRYSMLAQDRDMAGRANNAIKYTGSFGGLTASALYSFGYGDEGERPGDSRLGREYAFGLGYAAGPFGIGAVYDQRIPATDKSLGRDVKVQRAALAGSYAIGPAKAFAGYRWAMLQAGTPHARSNLWWAGLGLQATPALSLKGAAYYQDFRDTRADPWLFVASADYALSKRTDAYVNVALAWNRADAGQGIASNLGVNGGDSLYGAPAPFLDGTARRNQVGAVVGIRHKF